MQYERRGFGMLGRAMAALFALFLATGALLAPVAAAQDTPTPSTVDIQTRAMFLHAAPSLDKVEVAINWDEQLDEFAYGDQSDFIDIPPGAVEVSITHDRHGFNYLLYDAIYPVPAGNDYYCVITDQIVVAGAFDTSPIVDGGARVQVIQGSVSLPAVNVVATRADVSFATDLQYPRSSDYTNVPAATYELQINLADTGETVATIPNVTLNGNSVYELVIMGTLGDENHPLTITPLEDTTDSLT
jgi:Domain of unknown function (DUF4397)